VHRSAGRVDHHIESIELVSMYHYYPSVTVITKRKSGAARCSAAVSILLFLALLAMLISNAAGSLACRLA
jgi:hypothetical protein